MASDPILFINLFINLRGPEGAGNVGGLKVKIYEEIEPLLNGGGIVLLDHANLESQFFGLVWRGGKIDYPNGEHDDYANGAAGALNLANKNQVFSARGPYRRCGQGST
jgi:hypothetical protein